MKTTITLITKLLTRFQTHSSRAQVALAENLAEEINLYPGLPDRILGLRSSAPARRESVLRQVAQRYRTDRATSEAADALCRLTNPTLFERAVPFLRGTQRRTTERQVSLSVSQLTLAGTQLN
jgi:hypothetical protein